MRILTTIATISLIASATSSFAAGSDSSTPPKKTKTVTECAEGQIFDEKTGACVDADKQSFNDTDRYDAVRELAYAGEYDRATLIIAAADTPDDARFLNYQGFIQRKLGNTEEAFVFYRAALAKEPSYHLARSYMGQGMLAVGDYVGAKTQLDEIAARGGKETWAYAALEQAIRGIPSDY